jgi:hypothetical protein
VSFKAQDAINCYSPVSRGGSTGYDPLTEVDAVATPGKKAWELWIHESSPGVGVIKIYHKERPSGEVTVPLSTCKSWEARWLESPYKELLAKEAEEAKAAKAAAEAEKATAGDRAATAKK